MLQIFVRRIVSLELIKITQQYISIRFYILCISGINKYRDSCYDANTSLIHSTLLENFKKNVFTHVRHVKK